MLERCRQARKDQLSSLLCFAQGPDGFRDVCEEEAQPWTSSGGWAQLLTSHFMTGETFIILLHGLISPALALQRIKLGLPHDKKALLLCDAWSGFHTFKGGLDAIRAAWSEQAHCVLPAGF